MNHKAVLGGLCASLLAFACSGTTEGDSSPADEETAAPAAPAANTPSTPAASAEPTPATPTQPTAPAANGTGNANPPTPDPTANEPPAPRQCSDSLSFDDIFSAVQLDLTQEDDTEFLRYVTISNRLNEGTCSEDLETQRAALVKVVNSLSTEVQLSRPEPIDAEATIYRIDLRELGWDEPTNVDGVDFLDKWEAIIANSAYAVEFEGDEADASKLLSNTTVPVLSADALIDAATVGNLYYALIGIGETEDELLEEDLAIDEEEQEDQGIIVKAGTSASGLSTQDSVVERLLPGNRRGYYWGRYDLAANNGGQSVFADPLGFQEDSISAVFSLPNGLNGYALFDAAGVRIAETNVIVDQTQRDGRMRNSVSCSQCHAAGINPIRDEVRSYVEANAFDFDADTLGDVLDFFREQPEVDEVVEQDSSFYRTALTRMGIESVAGDPISAAYQRFDAGVTLQMAAGELGVTPDILRAQVTRLSSQVDPSLSGLSAGTTLQRERFDDLYLATLCVISAPSDNRPLAADCAALGL